MTALAEWNNFYVIVGSSAGALIGLRLSLAGGQPLNSIYKASQEKRADFSPSGSSGRSCSFLQLGYVIHSEIIELFPPCPLRHLISDHCIIRQRSTIYAGNICAHEESCALSFIEREVSRPISVQA